ncbi:uncharacterized protein LOC143188401 [Calliopsis andreniformis]|uniref:uncharacterized protein LOC143188401 n=1 Tax=Calliopsis andreniformis TaxID=337506 RepID=UPI003FCE37B3
MRLANPCNRIDSTILYIFTCKLIVVHLSIAIDNKSRLSDSTEVFTYEDFLGFFYFLKSGVCTKACDIFVHTHTYVHRCTYVDMYS